VQGDEAEGEEASMFVVVEGLLTGEKTAVFLSHLYIKRSLLPRRARDKRRENSKKGRFFPQPGSKPLLAAGSRLTSVR
jgi:hypothetical protein